MDIEAGWGVVTQASSSCHEGPEVTFSKEDVESCLYVDDGCNCGSTLKGGKCDEWCDTWSSAILKLKDGRYVYATESSDTSGHG